MFKIVYIQTNIFALAILSLILVNVHRRPENRLIEQKLYLCLVYSNVGLLILDSVLWLMDGTSGLLARDILISLTSLYYVLNPLPCLVWSLYINFQVYRSVKNTRESVIPLVIPTAVNTVLSVMGCFDKRMFYFDNNNIYHRGILFPVMVCICLIYLAYTVMTIIIGHKRVERKYFMTILIYAIPPLLGSVVQSLHYGVSVVWPCMTFSNLIIYNNIQNNQLYTDHLTGLYNRRQLDYFIHGLDLKKDKHGLIAGIMIDMDCFKQINDSLGHSVGDEALIDIGKILSKSFSKNDLVCRYGGDEFIIIFEVERESDLISAVNRIKENTEKYEEKREAPYKIELSVGYDVYDYDSGISIEQFLRHIDNLMYENKKSRKNSAAERSAVTVPEG